jgi:hypothetical protein
VERDKNSKGLMMPHSSSSLKCELLTEGLR